MNATKHRILIAEDQDIARLGLRLTLEKMPEMEIIGEAIDGDAVLVQVEQFQPSVILMDVNLPGINGIQATRLIKSSHPNTAIIMFTSDSSDDTVFAALSAGADGYCLKNTSSDQLRIAINSVATGAAWLDPGIAQRVLRVQAAARVQTQQDKVTAGVNAAMNMSMNIGMSPNKQAAILDKQQVEFLQMIEKGYKLEQIADELKLSQASVEEKLRGILGSLVPRSFPTVAKPGKIKLADEITGENEIVPIRAGVILADRFEIEQVLGSGGVSTVYKGKDLSIGRTVAIKMLQQKPLTDEKEVKRFLQEAKTASAISHPNVITIFDFGVTPQGQPYMVMDYIDGVSLEKLIQEKKLTVKRTLNIFIQVCDAMIAAHKKGVIHRDLKPSNIMLIKTDEGEDMVKLVDFGMAKFILEGEDMKLSKTGDLFGTPLYMSPEHFRGEKLSATSDIYALGCVLYEALTREPPFNGVSIYELMNAHLRAEASRLPFLRQEIVIPLELEMLLFRMMAKDPAQRPESMAEIKSELIEIAKYPQVT